MQDLPAQEPRRGHEQHAQATVGRSAPPHRSAHRPPRDNTCRRGVCGRRDRTRRRGSREDSAHLGPRHMTTDQFMWLLARVCGLASYASLAIALLTGIALRTAVLDWLGSNRALRSLHEYTTVLWIPLGALPGRDDVGDRHAARWRTAHGDRAVLDHQVLRVGL